MSPTDIAEVSVPSNPIAGRLRLIAQAGVLKTLDPNGVRKTVLTDVDMCFAGEPVNYVAATPGTGTFTMENGEVTATMAMTAAVSGDLGVEYPGLQLVDPQVPDAELSLDDAGNFVVVSLATGTEGEILSRLDDVRDYINTHSVRMIGGDTTNGTTLCVPNEISQGVNGGTDEVLGTPARLGRTATDGTDVWTALKDDPTTTQDGWVLKYPADLEVNTIQLADTREETLAVGCLGRKGNKLTIGDGETVGGLVIGEPTIKNSGSLAFLKTELIVANVGNSVIKYTEFDPVHPETFAGVIIPAEWCVDGTVLDMRVKMAIQQSGVIPMYNLAGGIISSINPVIAESEGDPNTLYPISGVFMYPAPSSLYTSVITDYRCQFTLDAATASVAGLLAIISTEPKQVLPSFRSNATTTITYTPSMTFVSPDELTAGETGRFCIYFAIHATGLTNSDDTGDVEALWEIEVNKI